MFNLHWLLILLLFCFTQSHVVLASKDIQKHSGALKCVQTFALSNLQWNAFFDLSSSQQDQVLIKLQTLDEDVKAKEWHLSEFKNAWEEITYVRMGYSQSLNGNATPEIEISRRNWYMAEEQTRAWISQQVDLSPQRVIELHDMIYTDSLGLRKTKLGDTSDLDPLVTPPEQVERAYNDVFDWYNAEKNLLHPIVLAASLTKKLISIHPFWDGNGRTARLAADWILQQKGYLPLASLPGGDSRTGGFLKGAKNNISSQDIIEFYIDGIQESLRILNKHSSFKEAKVLDAVKARQENLIYKNDDEYKVLEKDPIGFWHKVSYSTLKGAQTATVRQTEPLDLEEVYQLVGDRRRQLKSLLGQNFKVSLKYEDNFESFKSFVFEKINFQKIQNSRNLIENITLEIKLPEQFELYQFAKLLKESGFDIDQLYSFDDLNRKLPYFFICLDSKKDMIRIETASASDYFDKIRIWVKSMPLNYYQKENLFQNMSNNAKFLLKRKLINPLEGKAQWDSQRLRENNVPEDFFASMPRRPW